MPKGEPKLKTKQKAESRNFTARDSGGKRHHDCVAGALDRKVAPGHWTETGIGEIMLP
jgi:hypothetical protein